MSNLYSDFAIPGCAYCAHLYSWGITCKAYPKGIPLFIASGEVSHETPLSGDHGIQFEWADAVLPEDQPRYPPGDPLGRGGRYIDPNGVGEPINMFETLDVPAHQTSEYEEYMDRVKAEEPDKWQSLPQAAVMRAGDWQYAVDDVADDLYPEDPSAFWRFHVDFARWFLTVPSFDAMSALRASDMIKDLFDQDLLRWDDLAQADPILVTGLLMEDFDYWAAAATWSGEPADVLGYLAVFGYTLQDMVQSDYPGRDIWALMIEDSQQNEFLPFLALMPDPISFVKAVERDISHVLRGPDGRWINTPNAGDDKPKEPKAQLTAAEARAKIATLKVDTSDIEQEIKDYEAEHVMPFYAQWDVGGSKYSDDGLEMSDEDFEEAERVLAPHTAHVKALREQIKEKKLKQQEAIWDVLRVDNPVDMEISTSPALPVTDWRRPKLDEAALLTQKFISEDAWEGPVGTIRERMDRLDMSIRYEKLLVMWATLDEGKWRGSAQGPGRINIPKVIFEPTAMVVHEIGHLVEENSAYILDESMAFFDRRTVGEEFKSLIELTGNDQFNKDEESRPDDFISPYVGKVYFNRGGDEVRGTEIISMGLENYVTNTVEFAEKDPDHFDFTYDILHGNLRPKSTKSHHWDQVVRDEMGRWSDTPGSGMEDPSRPTGAPKWATDGRGRKGDYSKFEEKAKSVSMESGYDQSYDAAPTADQLKSGHWEDMGFGPTSYGIWKVTDQDGKDWFVKRMLDFGSQRMQLAPKNQSMRERDAGYLGRSLGLNIIPAHEIHADEFGDFIPPGLLNTSTGDHGGEMAQPENFFLTSPFINMTPAAKLTQSEKKSWRESLSVDTRIKASLFDMFLNNTDRNTGNYGAMNEDNSLALIDHGFAFRRNAQGTQSWLNEVPRDTVIDRSYLLWMRGGIEKASKHMMPENRKFMQQRYNQIKKWWEKNSAGERGLIMTQNLEGSGFFHPSRYG